MSEDKGYWVKSGLLSLFERLSVQIFNFGAFFLLVRNLGKSNLGLWFLFMSVTALFEISRAGLLQNALMKFHNDTENAEEGKINTASLLINIFVTLGGVVILLAIAPVLAKVWESPIVTTLLKIHILAFIALIPAQQFNFLQQAKMQFQGIFWSNFIRQGLFFAFVLILFLKKGEIQLEMLAKWQILTALASSIVSIFFAKKYFVFERKIDWTWVRKMLQYGKYTLGTNIGAMLYKMIDKWMLGALLSKESVGIYEICIKINNLMEVPAFAIASVVFPKNTQGLAKGGSSAVKNMFEKAVAAILAIIIPGVIFVFFFSDWIVTIIAGIEKLEAAPLMKLTILYMLFVPFSNQFGTTLDSVGKPKINFWFVILGAGINIVSNYFFIGQFGIWGAAFGTIFTYIVMFAINQIVLYKLYKILPQKSIFYIPFFYKKIMEMIPHKN